VGMFLNDGSRADSDGPFDDTVSADADVVRQLCFAINDGRGVYQGHNQK
jgi:hypothetical protein